MGHVVSWLFQDGQNVVGIFNSSRHGEINGAVDAVPFESKANEFFAGPVGGDFAEIVETVFKVLCISFVGALDSKVIDDECKHDRVGFAGEQTVCCFCRVMSTFG